MLLDETEVTRRFEKVTCNLMTGYRAIAALGVLTKGGSEKVMKEAWLDLRCIYISCMGEGVDIENLDNLIREFIRKNKNWILYTLADMAYYANNIVRVGGLNGQMENARMNKYAYRMKEQAEFLTWNKESFTIRRQDSKKTNILDIGCGAAPYIKYLFDNTCMGKYIGLDKRDMTSFFQYFVENNDLIFIQGDVSVNNIDILRNKDIEPGTINTLFFAEFLHCLSDPISVIARLIKDMPAIDRILILELDGIKPLGLSCCFPFHMVMHGGYGVIDRIKISEIATQLGFFMTSKKASTQHTMYRMEKI